MRFIAFDIETTGLNPGSDRIVELGAVKFDAYGKPEQVFSTLIDPEMSIPEVASRISGITDDMVKGQPKIADVLDPFAEFCQDDVMVAHNAPFDFQFIASDIKKYFSKPPLGLVLDTCAISRKVFPGLSNYKLGTLVQHLKIPSAEFHRAEQDSYYCGYLFVKILEKLTLAGFPPTIEKLSQYSGKVELRFPKVTFQPQQLGF